MSTHERFPRPIRAARNAARRLHDTLVGVQALQEDVARLTAAVEQLASDQHAQHILDVIHRDHARTVELLGLLRDDEPGNRQRLWRLRDTPEYALAFEETEPLVSFAMATYSNIEGLMERSIPSVLAQTYERIELVIVGDGAAPELERAVRSVRDPRVRFFNLTLRGPYPQEPERLWRVAGAPPSNEAMRLARGRWIAGMDDDDHCRPDRAELLLHAARENALEFCYGQILMHLPDAPDRLIGAFPPAQHEIGLQASLMHTGLRFICAELSDADFNVTGDWSRIRRMLRIGVRMGAIDDVVLDYYPGSVWRERADAGDG